MRAAAATDKLRRAYRLSLVHEELRQVVFAARGPVAPASLPARHETAGGVDVRTWTRLCAPERAMSRAEVAECARRLRARVATPRRRRSGARCARAAASPSRTTSCGRARTRRARRGNRATRRRWRRTSRTGKPPRPRLRRRRWIPSPRRCAGASRRRPRATAEMRADREAALTDMIDAEVAAAHSEYAGGEDPTDTRRERGSLGTTSRLSRDARKKRLRRAKTGAKTGAKTTTRGARRMTYRLWTGGSHRSGSTFLVPAFVGPGGTERFRRREGNRRARRRRRADWQKKVPWGHGPGSKAEEARAREAAERRTGESGRTESRFGEGTLANALSVSLARPRRDPRAAHARALASPLPSRRRLRASPSEAKLFSAKLLSAKLLSAELCLRGRRRVRPRGPRGVRTRRRV